MWFGFFLVKDVVAKIGTRYDKCYYVKKCYHVTIRMSLRYMYYLDVVIAFERTNRKTKLINWSPCSNARQTAMITVEFAYYNR